MSTEPSRAEQLELCLSTWSLHRNMGNRWGIAATAEGLIWQVRAACPEVVSLLDFPRFARHRYGLRAVELCQTHFPSLEPAYLAQLKANLDAAGVRVVNIPVDVGNISHDDPAQRQRDLDLIGQWFVVAATLGAPSIRVNSGRPLTGPPDLSVTIASYRQLAERGRAHGVRVLLENHGGLSADLATIMRLVEGVGSDWFRLCPDFGNFAPEQRAAGLRQMVPYAVLVHAKTLDFNEAGDQPDLPFAECLQIVREAGYTGPLSIEFEGEGDQFEGVARSIALIERTLAA